MSSLRLPFSIEPIRRLREFRLANLIMRGMPEHASATLRLRWPLFLVPWFIINQLLTPHPVWIVFLIVIVGLYGCAVLWIRTQALHVSLDRRRVGRLLIVGDVLQEEFTLRNASRLPILWAELDDGSTLPGYQAGQVAACGGNSTYRWKREIVCRQRGVFHLGPHALVLGDPFGLLTLRLVFEQVEVVVIYPRVIELQYRQLPQGQVTGIERRRKTMHGTTPAYSVLDYQPGDSLRRIHWRATAHWGRLMVRELETEPTGDIWLVLDLNEAAQREDGPLGTLEFGIVAAASMAAALLNGPEGRAVGLLAHGGIPPESDLVGYTEESGPGSPGTVIVRPKVGSAQLWHILTALAPVQPGSVSLGQLLTSNRELLGRRSTLLVITPETQIRPAVLERKAKAGASLPAARIASNGQPWDWPAELLNLRSQGLGSSVLLIEPGHAVGRREAAGSVDDAAGDDVGGDVTQDVTNDVTNDARGDVNDDAADALRRLLIAHGFSADVLKASEEYVPLLTQRRKRTVVRTTPRGGIVTYEVDEEVG